MWAAKKSYLSLRYNGAISYLFVNGVEIYISRAKVFEITTATFCLGKIFQPLIWEILDYMSIIFQAIMIILM